MNNLGFWDKKKRQKQTSKSFEVKGTLAIGDTQLCQSGGWDCKRHNVGRVAVAEINWISSVPTPAHMQACDIKCPYL